MTNDDITDELGELYRDEMINMDVSMNPNEETRFSLADSGKEQAEDLIRSNDSAAIMMLGLALNDMERSGDAKAVAKEMTSVAKWLRDDAGVNIFRILQRNPDAMPGLDADSLPESFVEVYDAD